MLRHQSAASRLCSSFGQQQRKLFLLVFLWTCLCLVIFKSSLFGARLQQQDPELEQSAGSVAGSQHAALFARSPDGPFPPAAVASSAAPIYLAPEFALPDNSNSNALYYSLSSISSSARPQQRQEPATPVESPAQAASIKQQQQQQQQTSSSSSNPKQQQQVSSHPKPEAPPAGSQCHYKYPNLLDLQFNNIHWQKMSTRANATSSSANYYLYNAYYDDRWRGGLPSVRVLAMIDRVQPPPTNCLLWTSAGVPRAGKTGALQQQQQRPIVARATFVYAWYPKWGNYRDGLLQPWIVTCQVPRAHPGLVPDSVSLVEVPPPRAPATRPPPAEATSSAGSVIAVPGVADERRKRQADPVAFLPPSFSSSSSSSPLVSSVAASSAQPASSQLPAAEEAEYDCDAVMPITNNLPVMNQRPPVKGKFAVCVKGLDFPHEDVSVRLVEWIELLNLLGAGKIFLYNLDVHENISKVLHYYQQRGLVELSPLTLPGDQPNLPEYQHLYLKSKLTAKRQNELIPYNDCLYRNLNSYQYLALLDIDEIIMPLRHHNWYDLMAEVEGLSLAEQNYSRASYNVRNVYFFDDLAGPLGTTSSSSSSPPRAAAGDASQSEPAGAGGTGVNQQVSSSSSSSERQELEHGIPHYLHMMQHVYRSKNYTKPGQYVKCFHNTERVVSLHNHFPMNCFGQCTTYSVPVHLAHLQHYRKDCVGPLKQSCKSDFRVFTTRDTTIWKYKQQMIRRTTRVLNHLSLL